MKINKFIIGLAIIAGGLTSCDTDNVSTKYNPTSQNISFDSENSASVTTTDSEVELYVTVWRSIKQGSYTAHYTMETSEDGIFTDTNNGAVTFLDGESKATITLKASNFTKGSEYTATLTLSDADIMTADSIIGNPNIETTVTVTSDYAWTYLGEGYYYSELFEEGWTQPVYKAEGANVYKMTDCVYSGYDLKFELSADGQSLVAFNPQPMGYKHATYGMVYYYAEEMTRTGNKIAFPMYGLVVYNGSLATLWSGFTETIELPE